MMVCVEQPLALLKIYILSSAELFPEILQHCLVLRVTDQMLLLASWRKI